MTSDFTTIALLLCSGALNAAGAVLQRYAHGSGDVLAGVLGCLCWAGTSLVFLVLLGARSELTVAAATTSAAGIVSVALVGVFWFGDTLSLRQILALGAMIVSILALSLPGSA